MPVTIELEKHSPMIAMKIRDVLYKLYWENIHQIDSDLTNFNKEGDAYKEMSAMRDQLMEEVARIGTAYNDMVQNKTNIFEYKK